MDIVIVNWNAGKQLRECVDSVIQHGQSLVGQIIVVDNGSVDGSENAVANVPQVTLLRAGINLGFGKACNLGAAHSSSDLLLFLNPDTQLFADSLVKTIAFMQQPENSKIGICGIRLVDEEGNASTSAARFPTLRVMAGKVLCLTKLLPRVFPSHQMISSDLIESCFVDQVIGAFFLIRKEVFDQCHGFDERFFVYFEEVDLSVRAKRLGYYSYYLSYVSAFHKGGGCSEQVKATRLFYLLRSRVLYAQKHYSYSEFVLLLLLTGLELPLRLVQSVMRASWSDTRNTFAAFMQLLVYFVRRD